MPHSHSNNTGQPSVYDRLYSKAVEQITDHHNMQAELMQSKLAISIKPWEAPREKLGAGSPSWTQVRFCWTRCIRPCII
jgi:hypothetical protein